MNEPLDRLADRVRTELDLLEYPRRDWLPTRRTAAAQPIYDVVIVGAGQGGLAAIDRLKLVPLGRSRRRYQVPRA